MAEHNENCAARFGGSCFCGLPPAVSAAESPAAAVRAFHEKFNFPIDRGLKGLRGALLAEEYREYTDAEAADDFVAIADALGDMVYVIYGTALTYGIPLDAVVAEIHRSNMTKETHPSGKAFKGAEYDPPRLAHVLAEHQCTDSRSGGAQ